MNAAQWTMTLALVLLLSWLAPGVGVAIAQFPVVSFGVAAIFLMAGIRLPFATFKLGLIQWRFHLATQLTIFAVMPLLCWLLAQFFEGSPYRDGIILLGCLPTTISSCVVLTGMMRGDEWLALVSAMISNLLAVFISPLLVYLFLDLSTVPTLDPLPVIQGLLLVVLAPFALGQIISFFITTSVSFGIKTLKLSASIIFFILYLALCQCFASQPEPLGEMAGTFLIFYMLVVFFFAAVLKGILPRAEGRAFMFVGSQKSIAVGIPLIALLDLPNPEHLLVPLICYHYVQLLLPGIALWGRNFR